MLGRALPTRAAKKTRIYAGGNSLCSLNELGLRMEARSGFDCGG